MRVEAVKLPWGPDLRPLPLAPAATFLVLLPTLIGIILGATRAGAAMHFPWAIGMTFWVGSSVGVWLCLYGGALAAALVLKPWRPGLWLVLAAGALAGSFAGRYVVFGLAEALAPHMLDGRTPRPAPRLELSAPFALYYVQTWAGVFVTWIVAGLAFDRWLAWSGTARPEPVVASDAGSEPEAVARDAAREPAIDLPASSGFIDRLPVRLGRDVVALEAADHYVRVHTTRGATLVLGRLSDAIEELAHLDGVRVHRSWWVRRVHVRGVRVQGRGFVIDLTTGVEAPVSQAYKEVVRQARLGESAGAARPAAARLSDVAGSAPTA